MCGLENVGQNGDFAFNDVQRPQSFVELRRVLVALTNYLILDDRGENVELSVDVELHKPKIDKSD